MPFTFRRWTAVPAPKLFAGPFTIARVPSLVLGLVVVSGLALATLTADRIARVERLYQPALEVERQLGATLEATRAALHDRRLDVETRIARADSQAQRFHRVATTRAVGTHPRPELRAFDVAFTAYYVAARRAALGITMRDDADGSSAEDAALSHGALRQNLSASADALERELVAARPAGAPIELAAWLALALVAGAALMRRSAARGEDWPIAARASELEQPATQLATQPPTSDAPTRVIPLRDAVERLARQRLAASIAAAKV